MAEQSPSPLQLRLRTLALGALTLALYLLLFAYEDRVLAMAREGRWFFILPIAVAFLFSFFHGAFTSAFWEMFGVRAKNHAK
ncbi:MAG: hypothetical protein HQL56_15945 [Magnetococcales bacterium]|nr:hypothetical protein [Magnetococcales bacterium]